MADICHMPSDPRWSETQKHLGGESECGKWPRHGEGFDATMITIRIQADGGKRSIDGGFYSRRCRSRSSRGLYGFILRSKARIVSIRSITKHNGRQELVPKIKSYQPSVQTIHDSNSEVRASLQVREGTFEPSDDIPEVHVDSPRARYQVCLRVPHCNRQDSDFNVRWAAWTTS